MKPRPLGVTILAVLLLLNVGAYAALIVLDIRYPDQLRTLLEGATPGSSMGPAPLLQLGAFLPVYFLAMAIFTGFVGRGLWRLKNWARLVVIFLAGISAALGLIEMVRYFRAMDAVAWVSALVRIGIAALVAWYLSAKARSAFVKESHDDER